MQLKTSRNNIYTVDWIDTVSTGGVFMQMMDARPLAEIAAEFDGLTWLERYDENQGDKRFDGYGELVMIKRPEAGVVVLKLEKGV